MEIHRKFYNAYYLDLLKFNSDRIWRNKWRRKDKQLDLIPFISFDDYLYKYYTRDVILDIIHKDMMKIYNQKNVMVQFVNIQEDHNGNVMG